MTSENFRILENLGNKVNKCSYKCVQLTLKLYVHSQNATFAFNSTAQTINPSGLTFTVKYSMKDAAEITDNMLKNNYTIEVQALRPHSDTVSEATGEYY